MANALDYTGPALDISSGIPIYGSSKLMSSSSGGGWLNSISPSGHFNWYNYPRKEPERLTTRANQYTSALGAAAPNVNQIFSQNLMPAEQSLLQTAQSVYPGYAGLQQGISMSDADLARMVSMQDIGAIGGASRALDPEYFGTRANVAGGLNELMNKGLTGGERSEIERSLSKDSLSRGNNTGSNTQTVENAATYGGA